MTCGFDESPKGFPNRVVRTLGTARDAVLLGDLPVDRCGMVAGDAGALDAQFAVFVFEMNGDLVHQVRRGRRVEALRRELLANDVFPVRHARSP